MTKTVTGVWSLPTTRQDGGALPPEQVDHTLVQMSADGGDNWAELARVAPADAQRVVVPDLEVGAWHFRIRVVDTDGRNGPWHTEVVQVIDDSPPGPVTGVVFTQE